MKNKQKRCICFNLLLKAYTRLSAVLTPIILGTQMAEIERSSRPAQSRQKASENLSQ
jgi:hypothetical protein